MENEILDNSVGNSGLVVTEEMKVFLKETSTWAMVLAIFGFIGIGLMIIIGIGLSLFFSSMNELSGLSNNSPIDMSLFGIIYIAIALVYLMPIWYLYKFATDLKKAIRSDDQEMLHSSLQYQKKHYKFIGIVMIVMIVLYFVMFFVGALMGLMA